MNEQEISIATEEIDSINLLVSSNKMDLMRLEEMINRSSRDDRYVESTELESAPRKSLWSKSAPNQVD